MPVYTYRREDGTTFDYRQKFLDDPLTVDPETGQHVVRVIQPVGVVFKGSGFYINDSKSASHSAVTGTPKSDKPEKSDTSEKSDKPEKSEKTEKAKSKSESTAPASTTTSTPSTTSTTTTAGAAAD